jgi:hypothetical protein
MNCIVPLAGPQLAHPEFGLAACYPVDGMPLLRRTLETRPWWRAGCVRAGDMIFVLRDGPELDELRAAVTGWYPGCRSVVLSHLTQGALLSVLAGAAAVTAWDAPLVIDLADIVYDCDVDVAGLFTQAPDLGAIVPTFTADDPCYSYLRLGPDGGVTVAAEKQVISHHASAGTYIFRSLGDFLGAAGNGLGAAPGELMVRGTFFVCPVVNGLIRQGKRVMPLPVRDVRPISKLLHGPAVA